MADYEIKVSFVQGSTGLVVQADHYPAPGNEGAMESGDTLTWKLVEGDGEMQVGFSGALALRSDGEPEPKPVGPMGPFANISLGSKTVTGTIGNANQDSKTTWRYVCVIFRNGKPLPWGGGVDMGGVDTHTQPPM
jgi:hypothetical protein